MTSRRIDVVCWDCVKGRHSICPDEIPSDDEHPSLAGLLCECPVCHANRYVERQPAWSPERGYFDPGPDDDAG